MTVVLAIKCADGLVMGADTQVTEKHQGMSYPARKLHPLGERAAWGGSGARSVQLDLERKFSASAASILEADDVGRALQQAVLPVLRHHYEHFIEEVPGEESMGSPSAFLLAAGYSGEQPWIIEVNPHAMVGHYEDIGFHAIGSGAPMAQQAGVLLAHFNMTERPVDYGVVTAVRVLDALSQTALSVGGPLDLFRITPDARHHLDGDDIAEAREHVERWRSMEQDALDKLF